MDEKQTWRDLLGQIISNPREKHRIAEALGVNPITLGRWATSKSHPREDNLRQLINALPLYRQQMVELITREYPQIFAGQSVSMASVPEIPSVFYARVMSTHTTSPLLIRSSSISTLVLQQMLAHLDPRQAGMKIEITQCLPPLPGQKVRSLRKTIGRGTYPWDVPLQETEFMGAESQAGQAVISGHPLVIQNR